MIGENIKKRREELGMSQAELAKLMSYKSRSSINKIESGENDLPQSKIEAFAAALNTTPAALMGWDDASKMKADAEALANEILNNEKIKKLIPLIAKMDDSDLEFVTEFIKKMSK